jgi:FSR family fosmidomycin resistance protein-like MFS transporter
MAESWKRTLLGVTVGHAVHDAWYGVAPVLLAVLSKPMGLSNSDIGLMLLLYQGLSSLTQPFFGRLAERIGGRPLAVASILWTTAMYSGILFAPSKLVLGILITIAGFGSGAWHPQATTNATVSGGKHWGATAASVFFQGGTLGSALLGAALGGYLLSNYGRQALLVVSAIAVLSTLFIVRPNVPRWLLKADRSRDGAAQGEHDTTRTVFWVLLAFLLLSTALRALSSQSLNAYVPKLQQDLGVSPARYGLLMSVFMIASAAGGLLGSIGADKLGIRSVLAISLALAGLLLFGFLRLTGLGSYLFLILAGFCIGPSHTLFVVAGQRLFPTKMAMISGVFLGFTFFCGAGGTWLLGLLADRIGLGAAMGLLPWVLFASAALALVAVRRPAPKKLVAAESEGQPATP